MWKIQMNTSSNRFKTKVNVATKKQVKKGQNVFNNKVFNSVLFYNCEKLEKNFQ